MYKLTPADTVSQVNLAAQVLAAQITPAIEFLFMCRDASGTWARRAHTAARIAQVGLAGRAHVVAQLDHLDTLRAQIAAATTISAVDSVVW